jgi:biopolymer transport protein TolR
MRRPLQRQRVMGEINITPLTDVMLVLLVIFMVTTPLILKAGIDINLPKAHAKVEAPVQNIQISLSGTGQLLVDGQPVTLEQLGPYLAALFRKASDSTVTVAADERVPYGDAVRVLDIARQAGANKLILAAEPLPATAPPAATDLRR